MADETITSITDKAVRAFINNKSNKDGSILTCKKIRGFQFRKRGKSGAYRWRYQEKPIKKDRFITLGKPFKGAATAHALTCIDLNDKLDNEGNIERYEGEQGRNITTLRIVPVPPPAPEVTKGKIESKKPICKAFSDYPPSTNNPDKEDHFDRLCKLVEESGFKLEPHHIESMSKWADTEWLYERFMKEAEAGLLIQAQGDRNVLEKENPAFKYIDKWDTKLARYRKEFGIDATDTERSEKEEEFERLLRSI